MASSLIETQSILHSEKTPVSALESAPHRSTWRGYFELTRLHKASLGNGFMTWPCLWALSMGAFALDMPPHILLIQTVLYIIGSILMHSATCVWNDICDIDIDRQVERTKNRPLPAGIIPMSGAYALFALIVVPASAMLLMVNTAAALCGLVEPTILLTMYPLMKRWTHWPQAWLGLTLNWGLPTVWIALTGGLRTDIVVLFIGMICWTIVYDTMYACQDREEDKRVGVNSTAVLFGDWVREILLGFTVVFLASMVYAGVCNGQGLGYWIVSFGGTVLHFVWQFLTWDVESVHDGRAKFNANGTIGLIVWIGLLIDYALKVYI